jgi:aspartate aminotransferase
MAHLSERVQRIKPSPTLAISARAAQLRQEGRDVIGLGAGEPDFDTPSAIKDAAIKAIHDGMTRYTPVEGIPALRQAVIDKFQRDNGLSYEMNQVMISSGGKQTFYNLCHALLNPGDEVIIPAPYWVSYPDIVYLADGVPVIVAAEQDQNFKITPAQLEAAITPKTRLVVINSPSNPTGVAYSASELKALGDVLANYPDVWIATDDMYEKIIWTEAPFVNILNTNPELYARTMVLNGVSKAYAMTGWRIGYVAGDAQLIKAMTNIQSQSTSNPSSVSQHAALSALSGDQSVIAPMVAAFKERHDYVVERFSKIPGVACKPCDGTFYLFVNVQGVIANKEGINNDLELAEYLLNEADVAIVPGSAFGLEGYFRMSYATSMENLVKAIDRIEAAFRSE